MMNKRENGYYFVKLHEDSDYRIANWYYHIYGEGDWHFCGNDNPYDDDEIFEINEERIKIPGQNNVPS